MEFREMSSFTIKVGDMRPYQRMGLLVKVLCAILTIVIFITSFTNTNEKYLLMANHELFMGVLPALADSN